MSNDWLNRAVGLLDQSLNPIANELNELDWKEKLSTNKDKLKQHLIAMSNLPGGGFLVFGIKDDNTEITGVPPDDASVIIEKLSN